MRCEAIAELLPCRDAEPEHKDSRYSWSPWCWAAEKEHVKLVRLLLDKGAEFEIKDKYGEMPRSWAAANGQVKAV
jgi:ankyrin repeat protein